MADSARDTSVDAVGIDGNDLGKGAGYAAVGAAGPNATFRKGIVIGIISTPGDLIDLFDDAPEEGDGVSSNPFHNRLQNEAWAKKAPRGSILCKELSDVASDKMLIAYPMLQSHIMLPIAVGELVWIFVDGENYYWFGRIAGSNVSEDVNFTHIDRDLETPSQKKSNAKEKKDIQSGAQKRYIGRFNNGAGGDNGGAKNSPEGFDTKTIKLQHPFSKELNEAVPRYTPRPGDTVFQGSNNTCISMGTDRGWAKDDADFSKSNAHEKPYKRTGSIDIVAGRGRGDDPGGEIQASNEKSEGEEPTRTGMRLMTTEFGEIETNKLMKQNEESVNSAEGDPDFHADASRVYVSMSSTIDERLTLSESIPILALEEQPEDVEAAAIAIKSNEIRVVSRHDGSIRIVKEKEEGETGSSIIMMPDGSIHITGEMIFLGKSKEEGGHSAEIEGPYEPGMMQPYIKFSVMKEYLEEVHDAINGFCQTLSTHLCPMNAPSPQINSAASTLKSKMKKASDHIEKLQSTRIFGE